MTAARTTIIYEHWLLRRNMVEFTLTIALMMVLGYLGGALAVRLRLPRITGYIFAGVLLSPSILPLLDWDFVADLSPLAMIALGIIGYSIGAHLHMDALRGLGKSIIWITALQGVGAWLLTVVLLTALGPILFPSIDGGGFTSAYLPIAFLIGAIAWPTAPAVTIALIRETRAKGMLTTAVLAIVALSDAAAVIAFGVSLEITYALVEADRFSWMDGTILPTLKLGGSIALGLSLGALLVALGRLFNHRHAALPLTLFCVVLCIAIARTVDISIVLATLTMGLIAANFGKSLKLDSALNPAEPVVFILFFVISGIYFDLGALESAWLLAVLITVARCLGKYGGTQIGAAIAGAPEKVRNYLGFLLLPKAGLTLGLAFLVQETFSDPLGTLLFNGLLASTILNMILTPPLAKWALIRSGEAQQEGRAAIKPTNEV